MELVESLGIPVSEFGNFVKKQVDYFWMLDRECKQIIEKRNNLARAINTTGPDLKEFQDLRPIHEKLRYAQEENVKKDKIIADLKRQLEALFI